MAAESAKPNSSAASPRRPWRWRERALSWLDRPLGRFLDYGCGPCDLLKIVQDRCTECHGVDVAEDHVRAAREKYPHFTLKVIGLDGLTDYPDEYFDTIAIIEVIEHVPDERRTLAELCRILKPGGRLVLTTPHRGLLTFLDVGNLKFALPGVHEFVHRRVLRNREYYEQRFERRRGRGLVGDISVSADRKTWHRHYKPAEILAFCPRELVLEEHHVYFPGLRGFMMLREVLRVLTAGKVKQLFWPLSALEYRFSQVESWMGDQLVMCFRKAGNPAGAANS